MYNVIQAVNERNHVATTVGRRAETLSSSDLRSDVVLSASGSYQWRFTKVGKGAAAVVTDQLLDQNDEFAVTHIAFALKKLASDTPTDAQHSVAKLYYFVNTNTGIFDGSDDANLQAVYNGTLSVLWNETQIIPRMAMRNFERVSTSQQGTNSAAIAGPVVYPIARDEMPNAMFGYVPQPPFLLKGSDKLVFTVNLPAALDVDEASETNWGCFLIKGYLVASGN